MKVKDKNKLSDPPSPPPPEKVLYDNRIKRKNVLALNEKVAAIREFEKNPVYKRIGRMFHCSPDQIKRIVQQKESILKAWEQRTRRCQDAKTLEMKVVRVSMLGKAVYDWIRRMMYYKDFIITDGLIQKIALQFKSAMGLQNFFPHQDWCDKFRQTYNITKSDSKLLKIGYTQGYSVQIKDIMKDVLSECTPDVVGESIEDTDESKDENRKETETHTIAAKRCNEAEKKNKTKTTTLANQQLPEMRPMPQLQPIRQLYIQTNGMPGMPQKVLVATPIAGQRSNTNNSAPPMTMTIIPLATIAKPPNIQTGQAPTTTMTTSEKQIVPPPMVEIKQEIKDEPTDIQIKQECISDDEDDAANVTDNQIERSATSASSMPDSVNQTQYNKKSIGETDAVPEPMDYDDNLTLSNLRKIIQTQGSSTATAETVKTVANTTPPTILPPRLSANTCVQIAATTLPVHSTTVTSTSATLSNLFSTLPPLTKAPSNLINRTTHKRKHIATDMPALPAIKSCSEARKYLKLLEDFALYKENFRLIGLITRADEVLRELDGNDDVDID